MKSIIVLSDTHGNRAEIEKLYPLFSECDYIIPHFRARFTL